MGQAWSIPFQGVVHTNAARARGSGVSLVTYAVTVMAYAVTVHRMRKEERYATERPLSMNGTESWDRTYTAKSLWPIAHRFFGVQKIAPSGISSLIRQLC